MGLCTFISPPLGYCVFTGSGLLGICGLIYIRMKREVTLGQVLSIAVTIIIACLTGWISLSNRVAAADERDKNLEIRMTGYEIRQDKENGEIKKTLQEINGTVNDIRLDLKDKADRPK